MLGARLDPERPKTPAELSAFGVLLRDARVTGVRCRLTGNEFAILSTVDRVLVRRHGWGPADRAAKTRDSLHLSPEKLARARSKRTGETVTTRAMQRALARLLRSGLLVERGRSPRGARLVSAVWHRPSVGEAVEALSVALLQLVELVPLRGEPSPLMSPLVSPCPKPQTDAAPKVDPRHRAEGLEGQEEPPHDPFGDTDVPRQDAREPEEISLRVPAGTDPDDHAELVELLHEIEDLGFRGIRACAQKAINRAGFDPVIETARSCWYGWSEHPWPKPGGVKNPGGLFRSRLDRLIRFGQLGPVRVRR